MVGPIRPSPGGCSIHQLRPWTWASIWKFPASCALRPAATSARLATTSLHPMSSTSTWSSTIRLLLKGLGAQRHRWDAREFCSATPPRCPNLSLSGTETTRGCRTCRGLVFTLLALALSSLWPTSRRTIMETTPAWRPTGWAYTTLVCFSTDLEPGGTSMAPPPCVSQCGSSSCPSSCLYSSVNAQRCTPSPPRSLSFSSSFLLSL
ncbi:hypothetical protein PDJAM_G00051870 [Pangasius djambal]|uniref:Uncharacterized protein n=1 Tax=Pangasius djambal TaxID=1691987 RepID=A0ACC5YW68_9TELE|nr:hypothetical protein [Pangasius djambal]